MCAVLCVCIPWLGSKTGLSVSPHSCVLSPSEQQCALLATLSKCPHNSLLMRHVLFALLLASCFSMCKCWPCCCSWPCPCCIRVPLPHEGQWCLAGALWQRLDLSPPKQFPFSVQYASAPKLSASAFSYFLLFFILFLLQIFPFNFIERMSFYIMAFHPSPFLF